MIKNAPTREHFRDAATAYMKLAWHDVTWFLYAADALEGHIKELEGQDQIWRNDVKHLPIEDARLGDVPLDVGGTEESVADEQSEYQGERDLLWHTSQRKLAVAASLIGQAAEFFLKGEIAGVSPYLLLEKYELPAEESRKETDFADLKSVDANQLPKIYNAVLPRPLTPQELEAVKRSRRLRNKILHTVDVGLALHARDLLEDILEIAHIFLGPVAWPKVCREFAMPQSIFGDAFEDFWECSVAHDIARAIRQLKPAKARKYFGVDKRSRAYVCPACQNPDDIPAPRSAYLHKDVKKAGWYGVLRCAACAREFAIEDKPCGECKKYALHWGYCCNCGATAEDYEGSFEERPREN